MIFCISIIWSKSSFKGNALIVIVNFLESTSIHLHAVTLPLFPLENSSNSSNNVLYKGDSFNLSLREITSQTFTKIEGISTFTQFSVKCA
jgi:hypothetical protein